MTSTTTAFPRAEEFSTRAPRSGLATRVATWGVTGILAAILVFFGALYLAHNAQVYQVIHGRLGYPLYIIPVIGLTHILGGVGLLVPHAPRLTQWVYAGLTFDLLLAGISHVSCHDSVWNASHPFLLLAVVIVSYVLRQRAADSLGNAPPSTPVLPA